MDKNTVHRQIKLGIEQVNYQVSSLEHIALCPTETWTLTQADREHEWIGRVLWLDGIVRDILEGRMLGKSTRGEDRSS